jgi:hypothetical protein
MRKEPASFGGSAPRGEETLFCLVCGKAVPEAEQEPLRAVLADTLAHWAALHPGEPPPGLGLVCSKCARKHGGPERIGQPLPRPPVH